MSYPLKARPVFPAKVVEKEYNLTLDRHQRDSLKWLLSLHRAFTALSPEFALCDTGPWLDEIYEKLGDEPYDYKDNLRTIILKDQIDNLRNTV